MNNQLFNQKYQKERRKLLRRSMPKGEAVLWSKIKNNQLGYKFRRQQGIDKYVVDFYCPELKLILEIDGGTHQLNGAFIYDEQRQKYLESKGLIVKRYSNDFILNTLNAVLDDLYAFCSDLKNKIKNT
ncbi:MAG TPA: DUF559 domain-containing protein [bacterium]|nr:DUF559 domain-containing protein [bacterium]HPL95215.1 DUF559 domain-containing protein [bacterium]